MTRSTCARRSFVLIGVVALWAALVACGLPIPGLTQPLDDGECTESWEELRDEMTRLRAPHIACESDEDCTLVDLSVTCGYTHYFFFCPEALRSDAVEEYLEEVAPLQQAQCGELRGCQVSPSCNEMPAFCENGVCATSTITAFEPAT